MAEVALVSPNGPNIGSYQLRKRFTAGAAKDIQNVQLGSDFSTRHASNFTVHDLWGSPFSHLFKGWHFLCRYEAIPTWDTDWLGRPSPYHTQLYAQRLNLLFPFRPMKLVLHIEWLAITYFRLLRPTLLLQARRAFHNVEQARASFSFCKAL